MLEFLANSLCLDMLWGMISFLGLLVLGFGYGAFPGNSLVGSS